VAAIARARSWDHRDPVVLEVGRNLADRLQAKGDALLEDGDLDAAYRAWHGALVADPTRAWLHRRAEELRDRRLGI
jgi:hypothetical protein